jgi:hypothetical protein
MKMQKIILILLIACSFSIGALSNQSFISNSSSLPEFSASLNNFNNRLDIFNDILFYDIEEVEEVDLDKNRNAGKTRRVFSPPELLRFIPCQQSHYVVSCKKSSSVSEFQHNHNHTLQTIILLL